MANGAIGQYLLAFDDALVAGAGRRERILAEVEDHLRDCAAALLEGRFATGEAQAEELAVARFGAAAQAAERFGPDPLGWAQRASGWFDRWRIAHPWLVGAVTVAQATALTLWVTGAASALAVGLPLLVLVVAHSLALRRRTEPGFRARSAGLSRDQRWLAVAIVWMPLLALVLLVEIARPTTTWFQAICCFYLICAAMAYWARPGCCADPACRVGARRLATGHQQAAARVRYTGWGLALAGPLLAEIVPVAAGRSGTALFALMVFVAVAPLPSRRLQQWLRRRRPALAVVLRAAPLLAHGIVLVARDPANWVMLLTIAGVAAYVAATREIWCSRARSDEIRRRLQAQAQGLAAAAPAAPSGS